MTNAFDWKSQPSVLAPDLAALKSGRSRSQTATLAVQRKEARDGKNPGTIHGLSVKGDRQIVLRKKGKR